MTEILWVTQVDYDMDSSTKVNLEFVGNDLVIDLVGGSGSIIVTEDQLPVLCGMLYRKVAGECNE